MNTLYVVLALVCVTGISVGQILFKKASFLLTDTSDWSVWLLNGWLWTAAFLYGTMTLLWTWLLRHLPLHTAYPFMGLSFLIVPVLARLFLSEPLGWRTIAGGLLILTGVTLAAYPSNG